MRPPSVADLLVGGDQLRDLFEVVGKVVTNFGAVEETLRYLDWQLQAYELAAAMPAGTTESKVQTALAASRSAYFRKHLSLSKILKGIDKGLSYPGATIALGAKATLVAAEWQALKATAQDLGNRRNALAHAAIGMSGTSPARSVGLFAIPQRVNPSNDTKLTNDIGAFCVPLGAFINNLTGAMPFRDHNTVTFLAPAEVIL
jgi:hypothetical protein